MCDCGETTYEPKAQETTALYYKEDHNLVTSGLSVKLKKWVKMKENAIVSVMLKLTSERWHSSCDYPLEEFCLDKASNGKGKKKNNSYSKI